MKDAGSKATEDEGVAGSNHELKRHRQPGTAESAQADGSAPFGILSRFKVEEALERRNRELQLLQQVSLRLTSTLDLDRILTMVLDEARHLLDATGCTLWRPQPQKRRLVCWQASGPDSATLTGLHIAMGQGFVGWSARHLQEVLVADTRNDPRHFQGVDAEIGVEIRSLLCLPLKIQHRLIGVLEIVSDKPEHFDESGLGLLKSLAASAAVAIENARLYHEAHALRAFNENIVQNMREGIILEDTVGQITFANPAAAEMLDCSVADLHGRTWESLVAPEHLSWASVTVTGRRHETVLSTVSDRRLPVIFSSQRLYSGNQLAGKLITFTDISERKEAEDALRRRNLELLLLNRVISASAEGQTVGSMLAAVCRELVFAFQASHALAVLFDDRQTCATVVAEYPPNGQTVATEATLSIADEPALEKLVRSNSPILLEADAAGGRVGELLAPRGAASALLLPLAIEGKAAGCVAVSRRAPNTFSEAQAGLAQHVGEQISGSLARALLSEEQQRLSAAVDQAAEAVLIADATGSVLYVNPSFEEITGYATDEIRGQNLATLDGDLWHRLTQGQIYHERQVHRKSDGSQFLADETAAPVRNSAGEISSHVVTLRDVTHLVSLEEQFYHAQKMEALGRIAGGIAHDYKNLLTIIEMASALLALQMPAADAQREHVASIQQAGRRARDLTHQLLRFSRRDSVKPEVLDLNRLVDDMGWLLNCLVDDDIEVRTRLDADPATVRVDVSQMEQVIMNLVTNARDAMPHGGVLTVETSNATLGDPDDSNDTRPAEGHVTLVVRDSGTGMDAEVKARLFEPFFTTKERGKGTGLGLSTVLSIVEQNHGQIEVESEPGRGSAFFIYLPRASKDVASESEASASPSDTEAQLTTQYPVGVALAQD